VEGQRTGVGKSHGAPTKRVMLLSRQKKVALRNSKRTYRLGNCFVVAAIAINRHDNIGIMLKKKTIVYRSCFSKMIDEMGLCQPEWSVLSPVYDSKKFALCVGYSVLV
jgi:hypothetical protein